MKRLTARFFTRTLFYWNRQQPQYILKVNSTIVRLCSTTPTSILQNITKKVDPFGKLVIELPYNVIIKPTDPHQYPNMDTLMVKIMSKVVPSNTNNNDKDDEKFVLVDTSTICKINAVDNDYNVNDFTCLIEVPVSYDVDVKTIGDGEVTISGMISDIIHVQTEFGSITGSNLQGKKITLSSSEGGSVTLKKAVQGNIEINTAKDGFVKTEKCLGNKLDISTENGNINLGSNYCEKAVFTTVNGSLYLNNLHMKSMVDVSGSGSLNITCLDGSLEADLQEGSTKIQIVRITENSALQSNGTIHLIIPEDNDTKLHLNGPHLEIDEKLCGTYTRNNTQFIGETGCNEFKVETSKNILVTVASWMESLNLKNCSTSDK